MAEICGECLYLDFNNKERYSSKDKYYCNEMHRYVEPTDRACRYYSYDKSHNNDRNKGGYQQSGCSFSVIIRDILGFADNCELLNVLRNFRENILKKDEQYLPILLEYDQVSPLICEQLQQDENIYNYCLEFFKKFLVHFAYAFKDNNIPDAIEIYKNMFYELKEKYGFSNIKIDLNASYDLETLGKGRIRKIATSEI